MKRFVCYIFLILFIISCFSCGTKEKETKNNITSSTVKTTSEKKYFPNGIKHKSWDLLKKEFPEIVGYLEIGGCSIKCEVVRHSDVNYYLSHNSKMEADKKGAIVADSNNDFSIENQVISIYGHNFDNGERLSNLTRFLDLSFIKKHHLIKFDTPDRIGEYEIFSVFVVNIDKNDFSYRMPDYVYQKRFLLNVEEIRKRSWYDVNIEINENDKLICFYTCYHSDNTNDECRLIVFAKKCDIGKAPSLNGSDYIKNKNIKLFTN